MEEAADVFLGKLLILLQGESDGGSLARLLGLLGLAYGYSEEAAVALEAALAYELGEKLGLR